MSGTDRQTDRDRLAQNIIPPFQGGWPLSDHYRELSWDTGRMSCEQHYKKTMFTNAVEKYSTWLRSRAKLQAESGCAWVQKITRTARIYKTRILLLHIMITGYLKNLAAPHSFPAAKQHRGYQFPASKISDGRPYPEIKTWNQAHVSLCPTLERNEDATWLHSKNQWH